MTSGKSLPCRHMNQHASGIATIGDSLYAINRLVYEEKGFTLKELTQILRQNWHGHEDLYEEIKHKFPKFGNDIDEVDYFTVLACETFCSEVLKQSPIPENGRTLFPTFYTLHNASVMGHSCGASADGRRAREAISENQSPTYGADKNGPTATLNSISKLPFHYTPGGILNLKIQPNILKGEHGSNILKGLITGYLKKGGLALQVMAVDRETLLDAVKHPEKHTNLIVRVTGFSAYYTTLAPEIQDEIIQRTEITI